MPKEKEDKGWMHDLTKKQKLVFGLASLMVVILIGVFAWLGITGRLKIGADYFASKINTKSTISYPVSGTGGEQYFPVALNNFTYSEITETQGKDIAKIGLIDGYTILNQSVSEPKLNSLESQLACEQSKAITGTYRSVGWQFVYETLDKDGKVLSRQFSGSTKDKDSRGGWCHNVKVIPPSIADYVAITPGATSLRIRRLWTPTLPNRQYNNYDQNGNKVNEQIVALTGANTSLVGSYPDSSGSYAGSDSNFDNECKPGPGQVAVFASGSQNGFRCALVNAGDYKDLSKFTVGEGNIINGREFNDEIDKITVKDAKVTVYADKDFGGESKEITADGMDLGTLKNNVSSLKVTSLVVQQPTVEQYYVKSVSAGKIYDENDNPNPPVGTGVKTTIPTKANVTIHVKVSNASQVMVASTPPPDSTYIPKVEPQYINASDGKNVEGDVVVSNFNALGSIKMHLDSKPVGSSSFGAFKRQIIITVVEELKITPTTATVKVNETKELFTVTGLADDDNHKAESNDKNIAMVTDFKLATGDNTKATLFIKGVKEGTVKIIVTSAGRTAEATVTVTGTINPCSSCTSSQECINSKCVNKAVINSFTANPETIDSGDQSSLKWTTTGATSCQIDQNIGGVAVNGSKVVKPTYTTTYTLTCSNGGEYKVTETATVTVKNPDVCDSGKSPFNAKKYLWFVKTLSTNASTSDSNLTKYLGQYTLSYYFDGFNKNYGEGKNGKASDFIGQGFWLKNKTGFDYLCLTTSGSEKTSVETTLPHKGLGMIGNPLGSAISIKKNMTFKFSSKGDSWISWEEAFNQGLLKAAFIWNNTTKSYLAYTNLTKYPDFTKYGYQTFANMQDNLGPTEGIWIAPKSTEIVTVKITK